MGSVREAELMGVVLADPALLDRAVEGVMDVPFPVVEAHADGQEVTRLLRQNHAVLVRQAGAIAGIVTRYDVVKALTQGR